MEAVLDDFKVVEGLQIGIFAGMILTFSTRAVRRILCRSIAFIKKRGLTFNTVCPILILVNWQYLRRRRKVLMPRFYTRNGLEFYSFKSFPRKRESMIFKRLWLPAFAGMTSKNDP
jgi:hypothetical protein